ncbi:MAG: type IV pilus modification PilV family protein, partial [Planctomycetota bacterium]
MTTSRVRRGRAGRRGFTLAEATLAMVLIGIAAAGVLLPFAGGASVQAAGQQRTLAALLAGSLIEQIAATPFDTIVGTYNYTESQGQMKDSSGATMTDSMYANFGREVSCQYVYVPQQSAEMAANFILATVKVY